ETLPLYCHVSSPLRVTDPSSAALHTLSLHDALPICLQARRDVEESSQTRRLDAPGAHLQPEAEALAHPADPVQLTVVGLFERRVVADLDEVDAQILRTAQDVVEGVGRTGSRGHLPQVRVRAQTDRRALRLGDHGTHANPSRRGSHSTTSGRRAIRAVTRMSTPTSGSAATDTFSMVVRAIFAVTNMHTPTGGVATPSAR